MTLLDTITAASATTAAQYPLAFSPQLILPLLKPDPPNPTNRVHLVEPVNGFHISDSNSSIIEFNSKFSQTLASCTSSIFPDSGTITPTALTDMLQNFIEDIGSCASIPVDVTKSPTYMLSSKLHWSFVTRRVLSLVIDACFYAKAWELLETLIANKIVAQGLQSALVGKLIAMNRTDLVCLCVKSFSGDLDWSDLVVVMNYFLSPSKETRASMLSVRKEWEDQAILAVNIAAGMEWKEKVLLAGNIAADNKVDETARSNAVEEGQGISAAKTAARAAKEAAVLLMVAYDGFTGPELCLHYLLSSIKVDDVVFSGAITKLSVVEILRLIRYLGKLLKRFERFPQAVSSPESLSVRGLELCQWVPTVEVVAEALGVIVDEWFSTLVLHTEFHQEMKSVEGVLSSLLADGRLCGSAACLIEMSSFVEDS